MKPVINYRSGFTLVELIIVIAIISVLASLAFMALSGETSNARDSARKSDLSTIENSINVANSKNRNIKIGTAVSVASNVNAANATTLKGIRGANVRKLTLNDPLVDSSILQSMTRDPKGQEYVAAFLNANSYQLYAVLENPETKVATTLVKGSFKEGVVVAQLVQDANSVDSVYAGNAACTTAGFSTGSTIVVSNAQNLLEGDKIKIAGGRELTIACLETSSNGDKITFIDGDTFAVTEEYRQGDSITLSSMVASGQTLICLTSTGNDVVATGGTAFGFVCPADDTVNTQPEYGSVINASKVTPYAFN